MVRETNNVCFGQIAQETQVVVREDNKRDHLKRSTEDVSPPNFSERNSGYYERNSRLVSENETYLRRSNHNSYQSSSSSNTNINSSSSSNNNSSSTNNPDNRSRNRDRLYRNGPNAAGVSSTSGSSATTLLSERTSSGASSKINNSRVPPTSWYEAAATYTNGPGGSGNADVSAANINHYQTAASTELQAAASATTNSTTTSSYTAYSYASSPAHNNNTSSTTTSSLSRNSTYYSKDSSDKDFETNLSTTPPLLNKNRQKLLKSSSLRSGSASPTSTTTASAATTLLGGISGAGLATMTSSTSSTGASTSSSSSSSTSNSNNNNNNNSRSNQTANNSCSSVSSTINSSNTNTNNNNNSLSGNSSSITHEDNTHGGVGGGSGNNSSNVSGILNAAALAAAVSKGGSLSNDGHKNSSSSGGGSNANSSSNASASGNISSNNPSTSASHHTSRSAAHAHFHGRSTTSSSRSHSRSPSSYSSSHSSSSSSSSTASSHSHASSPVGGRDVEPPSVGHALSSRSGSRSLQSAVAVPGTNPSGSNVCGSSSSSTSSTSSGTPTGNPVVHSEDNRPLAIRVRNLPARSSDTSLKDGLFHEYKKHGKVTWVKVVGQNAERYALVCFKKPEDVEKALEVSHDKLFFGCKIEVEPYQGYDVEDNEFRPYEAELDEYHPKSTRTLFIGNLEKEITASELRQHFECFGEIIEIDIKKQGMSAYAFCQYSDIVSVVKAMRKMDGEHLGNNRIKLGFGKSMPTNCVWIDGIGEKISESHLQSQFSRYGAVSKVVVDRQRQLSLVLYEQIQYAQTAVKEMRGATLRGRKLQVDFASRECQDAFYEKLEKQSAGSRFNRYESQSRSRASSFSRHQNSNDGCSPGNTPGSSNSSNAGVSSSTPAISSAIVAGSSALSVSNTTGGNTLASVVGQTSGNTTPARSRGSRSSRHTMDYEYLDTRRFRSCDEYSQGSATSHDEDNSSVNHPSSSNANSYSGIGLRSDSPLLSRLGPIVNSSGKESSSEMLELALSRRRCDKSPAKQKGDIRLFQKERAVLLEQLDECPSSGDESIVSPRKRMKIDHHSINSSSGLTQSHSLDEQLQPQHKNSNCDYLLNDPMHRKSEVRRLSECSSSIGKYPIPQQNHHHSHHAVPPPPHHHQQQQHHQQQLSRRPSIDFMATSGNGGGGGIGSGTTRHNSTSSSNSDHHPPPHQSSSSSSSLACKRRRVIGSSSSAIVSTSSLLSSSTGGGGVSNLSSFANDDCHHHSSRGRGHQLHSHHSHEASGGESADGSRPGTPLCDERPEVLPSEPRRVPRERPREPMVLPLPKFGIQFFQQYRSSVAAGNTPSYHHHHHVGSSGFTSSSSAGALGSGNNSGSSHLLSNSMLNRGEGGISNNSHSSLSHSSSTTAPAMAMPTGTSSGSCYLPSPSTRYAPHWRPHHHHHHHQQQHGGGGHHGPSGGATPSSSSSMVSPMRSRSLSSNSSDSDVPGQSSTGSPSLEERIRTLDEMYERWSGGGTSNSSNTAVGSNVVKRHDFNHTPPTWQHHRSNSQSDSSSHHVSNSDVRSNATPSSTPASRHKFLDIDVNEMQPSDIVKSVLAKKSIFDDDLQRLKKNHWYEPTSDSSQMSKAIMGVCTSPGLPNLQATKTPVVGCNTTNLTGSGASSINKPSGALLQRLSSLSPMNSPQASMSPYNSPSPSPSVTLNTVLPSLSMVTTTASKATSIGSSNATGPQTPTAIASTSPASSSGSKCLQYPFPTHPPLPNTAAPVQSAQPIPPPPAESSKPSITQPPLPPMEVLQPPQPPASSPTSSSTATVTAGSSTKPKTSALSKSLSVPPPPPPTTATTESRMFTKSVSVPGSTNLGTVKSTVDNSVVSLTAASQSEQNQQPQQPTGSSSLHPSKSHNSNNNNGNKEDDIKPPSNTSSSTSASGSASATESAGKRSEKSHKHNHRSSEDKKSSKNDRRKNSNSSQSHLSQASAAESSDADEHDSKKERKERQERREKELRKQQEREEREREEREREERERKEKERLEKERLEAERLEKERIEKERLEKEERERVQREKERIRKEEEQRGKEERERKEREDQERKLIEQREREENERREREEAERREREEREELLRKERKEREEQEQKEKEKEKEREREKLERQRLRDEKERERKAQEESDAEHKRDINLLKEHQRRKETASGQIQPKTVNDMASVTSQSAHDFFRHGETERQNNKENSTEESSSLDTTSASSGKHKNRKTSRNTSPVRHPKRRLSSQDSNASNSAAGGATAAYALTDDHAKRMRIDLQSAATQPQTVVNNHNSVNNAINERRDSKEHHTKDRGNKHNRLVSSGHKSGSATNSNEKEHNTKHHRNKHHHKAQTTSQATAADVNDVNLTKQETEQAISNCISKTEDDQQNTDHDMDLKPKIPSLLSTDDEEVSENPNTVTTQHHNKTASSNHKHREHGSGHHSRHKSNKREREHHREKKRHSSSVGPAANTSNANTNESVPSTPPSAVNCNATDEETMASAGNQLAHRRTSGHSTGFELNSKSKHEERNDRKLSRCSEDGSALQPQTPSHRQNNFNKNTPQSSSRRVLLSSAEDTDGGCGGVGMGADDDDDSDNRQHSIFDIPDDGPYVSMYDKVKARSCKNMQKQEEEKKIKATFSQLKQSRAKREEKKRSNSYDGDSDSEFDGTSTEHQKQHNRSGGSYKMLTGGLSSTDEEQDMEAAGKTPRRNRRRSSQASSTGTSIHPHRLGSDSDDNSVTQRRLKIQDNMRRLCEDGDDTSEDDLIRRHNSGLANKRLLHNTTRIASDSESQSQSAVDIKLKQEPIETSNDGTSTPILKHLKQKIKKEVEAMEASSETADLNEFKFKQLGSICSSADEQPSIKSETAGELLSANEIKKELKDYYAEEYMHTEQKFSKSPIPSASQHFSPEQAKIKKHKKSKSKRQKTPTQDSLSKEQIVVDALVKHSAQATTAPALLALTNDAKSTKLLTSPCYDAFDELKRGDTLVTHTSPELQTTAEKKRHKERKEKKREKLRHMSADVCSGVEMDKMVYEKEKHRLKKSKKSKSLDVMRQTSTSTTTTPTVSAQQPLIATVPSASCTPQHKQRSGGEKMEDIFGPISDEDDEDLTDSDIGGRDLNCIPNRNTSSSNMPGPIVSAALNPYKQEPLTPKSHTVEENEENKQKLTCSTIIGASAHLERVAERQHRKEKREKKRKEREKSRSSEQNQSIDFMPSPAVSTTKPIEDENSVDLDAAGRALEAQLMEDSDNKTLEDATPSTANTYRSDMTDVFLFSDCDENSLEMSSSIKHDKKEVEKEQSTTTTSSMSCKNKEKKKKKKRSKEEKQLHHQRRESSSSNASQLATSTMVAPSTSSHLETKLTIDVQAATKHAQKSSEEHLATSTSPLCKPSPSLPCLIGDDDEELNTIQANNKSTPNTSLTNVSSSMCTTPHRSSSKDMLALSPHMKDKQMISPIPKTPTINSNSGLNTSENLNKVELTTTPSTPTSSMVEGTANVNTNSTPTSSTAAVANNLLNKSNDSCDSSNVMESPSSSLHTTTTTTTSTQQKKKPEIFIPGFDGEIDERISESAVQSISAEFNTPLDPMADEPKIPVESPPDASKLEKLEESKSRVTISQEETESAVSALLGESFGNSSADYSFNDDDDGLDDLNNAITDPEPVMPPGEPDEEAALAAKAIECEVASSAITDTVEEDSEEVCKAIQSLRQEELDVKADTPQSVRDLQIDTDTEENVDEADSSGSHSLKIDETAQSNNSSTTSDKANTTNPLTEEPTVITTETEAKLSSSSTVITKVESPTKIQAINQMATEPKIEPPTITKQDQPAVQPVQAVLPPVSVEVSVASNATTSTIVTSCTLSTSINTTTLTGVTMSYTSTPIKTSITFAPTSTSSSTPKLTHLPSGKSMSTAATGYVMQPPTITIPEPATHFVVPQLVLSPRGVVQTSSHHNDSSSSSSSASMHSPSGHHMPPQSPVGAAYLMGVRAQSPHSPRQQTSRGNTPTPRQPSPHTPTPNTASPITVTPQQQQQQNILLQRTVQHQQNIMSPPTQGHVSQNNSPMASPTMQQRHLSQAAAIHKVTAQQQQQSSPNNAPEQHMIKINNYSTPPSAQTMNMVNIRIPSTVSPSQQQQQQSQLPSPQQGHVKTVVEAQQQHVVPIGQHILPISVQKMPPVPTHPTIISKVVTVTPQQAQQSIMQGPGGNLYSPPASGANVNGNNQSRQSPQIIQQIGGKSILQPQSQHPQSSQLQFMQQQQRQQQQQQQHMLQMHQHQQQIMHQQQQKLTQQPQTSLISQQQQQQQQQAQHNYVVAQQRNLPSPQQQQSPNTQQLKLQYQQHQMLGPSQQSPTQQHQQQHNVIQNSQLPQRFLVQQHIVGMSPQQQQQQSQTNSSSSNQIQNSHTQQQKSPIFSKQQQSQQQLHHLQQRQQSPSPHRLLQQQQPQQSEVIKDSPRVIMSSNQTTEQITKSPPTTPATKANVVDKQSSSSPITTVPPTNSNSNKPAEGVSVIRTPTPTTTVASAIMTTTHSPHTTMASNNESPTTTATISTSRSSVSLTEENVIKISPPKHDEIEQDSKEDSDYWSAKELNVVETNNTVHANTTASVSSTVIKKNESVTATESSVTGTPTPNTTVAAAMTKEQRSEETKSSDTQNKVDTKSNSHHVSKNDGNIVVASTESQGNTNVTSTPSYSQSGNVTTDHDTEDETETQQMPSFEQVPVQGRPSTRGTGAKRGRQPRGGKKAAAAAANIITTTINANVNTPQQLQTEMGAAAGGVQTRLRKPNATTPATRGRKGRPPRNLLLQQQQLQQQQQHHEQLQTSSAQTATPSASSTTAGLATTTATSSTVLTAAEKKARSQAAAAAAALASLSESSSQQQQQQHQDVYEFHDESGDESKTTATTSISNATSSTAANPDHRPRLILTIKSPAQGLTPVVKASEKAINIEPSSSNQKTLDEQPTTTAQSQSQSHENLATIQQTNQTEATNAELAAAANTRKSRRLLEKDRSTIDDTIEDVVRNIVTNAAGGNATTNLPPTAVNVTNVLASTLPKGAQTPPRRSGRNSAQTKPSKGAEGSVQSTSANPIGRPRKSKDRKNTNELDIEQTPSPQPKHLVHDISDVEDVKSVSTPPPADITNPQTTAAQSQPQPVQVSASSITTHAASMPPTTQATPQTVTAATPAIIPQHPKKKALAAAEIESYQSTASTATTTTTSTPNIHSALPAGGVPMLNTAAPATQKTTGGAADSVNKPLIDPVTGVVSGQQMQQAKEGNLPSATAASQPIRQPMDPKKMMQAAAAAAVAAENNTLNSKIQNPATITGSVATPITALTKPVQVEATAAQVAASTVATAMLNKSVSVVVKTSTIPPTASPPGNMMQHQQQHLQQPQQLQQQQQPQRHDIGTSTKQPIIMQQQTSTVMHAQHTNVRPPTSLKAHVLNSQKLQQQQQQSSQQQYISHQQMPQPSQQQLQQQTHQMLQQQTTTGQTVGVSQASAHVIQNTLVQRPAISNSNNQQQQLSQASKQLLVNIPPQTAQHTAHSQTNALNSPRHVPQHSQQPPQPLSNQQSLVIKQPHDMHTPQVLHVVSSKTTAPSTTTNKTLQSSAPSAIHAVQQAPNASPHPSYASYIQTTPGVGVHTKQQQQQLPQQPVVIHQQTLGVPSKTTTTPLVMPPGILGLPPHPAMVIQTKTSAPAQSPSAATGSSAAVHLQHPNQHTPSPPLQPPPQHLVKSVNNPLIHSMQTQGVSHVLNSVASPSPPSAVKPNAQQSSIASNVGASSLRTAIPTISPQSQTRIGSILLPGGIQVPPHFETSMHDIATYGSAVTGSVRTTQSPPPAHQQASPITPSEASFPGGIGRVGVPTREHLMIYQQLLRQHDSLNPALREYDEKLLGSSPPLELRRPGSVPRTVAVPHSLQSPQDRTTDSPQVAQVYVHNTRIPAHTHYDVTGRAAVAAQPPSAYYDATRQIPLEPPPAHRSGAVHSVVAPPPPPTVVVPHPTAGSSSPFMPAAPPATAIQAASSSTTTGHHTKLLEREREQREREQQLMREKDQMMVRAGSDAHSMQVATPPPHQQPSASHQLPPPHNQQPPPPQADSLLTLLQRYPVMWQGLLALKTDQAAVQMHFVFGNPHVARASLPCNSDGSTPPLRIAQRMRLEQTQLEGVAKKMQFENEHCMLLALPCGRDHADVLQQSRNLQSGFITYLQQKMAAGIVNIPMPGSEQAAYVVHIFPSCDFANENLEKAAPDLKNRVADIAHLLIVIATV